MFTENIGIRLSGASFRCIPTCWSALIR